MDGILPVYKPVGITSFDVIRAFKRAVRPTFKLGHAGTLDPFADGVMLLMLGKGTKQFDVLQKLPKTYVATAILGASSDTLDVTGTITANTLTTFPTTQAIIEALPSFTGTIEQKIPDYSAAKVHGQPRYKLARKGDGLPPKSKPVTIYAFELLAFDEASAIFRVSCSSGTYIRQLTYDLFASLGVESYLSSLKRESVGNYAIEQCAQIEDFTDLKWQDKVVPLSLPARDE